jgi:hypothetical protein
MSLDDMHHIDVHGGITFAGHLDEYPDYNLWWFGFVCAHGMDYIPAVPICDPKNYKTMSYALDEANNMARQLKD